MFSGKSLENGNKVNLLYWHVNPYVYDKLCDDKWKGPEQHFSRHVINAPWYEWAKEKELEIWYTTEYLALDDRYVYIAYTKMLPIDETFWRLKYEVIHKKNME